MSTREEVRQAIDETGGPVWCFVSDNSSYPTTRAITCRSIGGVTENYFLTINGNPWSYANLVSKEIVHQLTLEGILKKEDSPLIKALKEGCSVLCWVSDIEDKPEYGDPVKILQGYSEYHEYPFHGSSGWKYATPISSDYIL